MRGFTQSLVTALLGWIRMLVEGIWAILFSYETQSWLQWIAGNWLTLVVFLCLCGVVLDYVVWFLRWRPYYVWASSLRRMRRFFGGKDRRDEQPRRVRRLKEPPPVQEPETVAYAEEPVNAVAWEEQTWQQPVYEQPEPVRAAVPAVTADTILAKPRKPDYQEHYVRRFQRPVEETPPPPVFMEEPQEDMAGYPQEDMTAPEMMNESESWAPESVGQYSDQPLHPGIDYQALSRQYGWHHQAQEASPQDLPEADMSDRTERGAGSAWSFSGLDSFSPYRAPAPPQERGQRTERAAKSRAGNKPLSRVKSGLSRIAQRAGKVLTVDDEETGKLIDGLPPPIDKRRAFHAPVYPNRPGANAKNNPDFREDD